MNWTLDYTMSGDKVQGVHGQSPETQWTLSMDSQDFVQGP